MSIIDQVDWEIRTLVSALRTAGLDTDWCCSGEPGHMCIRPTVQFRTVGDLDRYGYSRLDTERTIVEEVMRSLGISDYWLLLNFAHGAYNTHGGEPTWILMVPGRFDRTVALPVAYSVAYQTDDYCNPDYMPSFGVEAHDATG